MLLKEERYLVTGTVDQELRVWKLNWTSDVKDEDKLAQQLEIVKLEETDNIEDSSVRFKTYILSRRSFIFCRKLCNLQTLKVKVVLYQPADNIVSKN